jgi:hypothetical protein
MTEHGARALHEASRFMQLRRFVLPVVLIVAACGGSGSVLPDPSLTSEKAKTPPPRALALKFNDDDDTSAKKCIGCHQSTTPAEVARYHDSLHSKVSPQVTCVSCHGKDGHGEYISVGYRFRASTLAGDGVTPIGGGSQHTYAEWQPKMILRAMQSCQSSACHARVYQQHVGVDRRVRPPHKATTAFHGMLRFDHGISSWNDTMMSSFGLALWESYGTELFREACVRCHDQTLAFNVAGESPSSMRPDEPFLRSLLDAQGQAIPSLRNNRFPGVTDESLVLSRCVECHVRHEFSRTSARQATACAKCHSGPDHPQIEAYDMSKHKFVVDQRGVYTKDNRGGGPTCATCHMGPDPDPSAKANGVAISHDLTKGLAWNYEKASPEWARERTTMLERCSSCHSQTYARMQLASADGAARGATDAMMHQLKDACDAALKKGKVAQNPFFGGPTAFQPTFFHAIPWQTGAYRASPVELACWNAWREGGLVSMETGAWHFSPQFTQWKGVKPADEWIGRVRELSEGR